MVWHLGLSRFVSGLLICLTALIGDNLVNLSSNNNRLLKALCDNITHGAVGALTWATVTYFTALPRWQVGYIALCTLLAMIIDLDHFAAARSFRIQDATSLARRPPFHCSTIPIVLFIFGYVIALTMKSSGALRLTCLLSGAAFSHHFRDAARRGLWLWPFGSTPPFHPLLYLLSIAVLPHGLAALINDFERKHRPREILTGVQSV